LLEDVGKFDIKVTTSNGDVVARFTVDIIGR
jgi:hypothetical protein